MKSLSASRYYKIKLQNCITQTAGILEIGRNKGKLLAYKELKKVGFVKIGGELQ